MQKIGPSKTKKRRNAPKKVFNRTIKSLENNFGVLATKNIINTPKIVIDEPQIVTKPKVVTIPKIVSKPEIGLKQKKLVNQKLLSKKKKKPITMNIKIV